MVDAAALLQEVSLSYNPPSCKAITLRVIIPLKKDKTSFKWWHFEPSLILLCVRWYCRYQLSYRDVEEMTREHVVEQDQRFVKKKIRASQCFKSFHTAERMLEGIEAVNMIRKGQVKRLAGSDAQGQAKSVATLPHRVRYE